MEFNLEKWVNNTPNDSNGYQNIEDELGKNVATCYGGFERSIPISKLIVAAPEMFGILKTIHLSFGGGNVITFSEKDIEEINQLLTKITE